MTHGCSDCGYGYIGRCEVYEDGTCKRDRAENYTEEKRMTNYEKIKAMSIEDMALEICETHMDCETCRFHNDCESDGEGIRSWLESSNEQA